ncbi:MAG: FMN-binding negative transcriptional regulator [Verrucomicrobiota bacterium]
MYTPAHFAEKRPEVLHALVAAHPLGTLVTLTSNGLDANLIPFELDPTPTAAAPLGTLRAHVARANSVWHDFSREVEALVVFQGPQAYITPTWYVATKPETGKVVPTWNYCVVHAHGPLQVIDDRAWLHAQVERLVRRHEATQPAPWHVSDAPPDFIEKQLAAIVGLEIPLTRLAGKWKVSQNRPAADRDGVVAALTAQPETNARAMAGIVRDHAPKVL